MTHSTINPWHVVRLHPKERQWHVCLAGFSAIVRQKGGKSAQVLAI